MAGLSSAYITWKLAAEGTTQATKTLILAFLNNAPNAQTIAGTEPVEGPIVDEPTEGDGDQVRDYDIGLTVAQRIIAKRTGLGSFTDLTQLARVSAASARTSSTTWCSRSVVPSLRLPPSSLTGTTRP
jgi:hypothetical protein